jgi:hypothetical protein
VVRSAIFICREVLTLFPKLKNGVPFFLVLCSFTLLCFGHCLVSIPLLSSSSPVCDFLELQRRYRSLLVPSDFLSVHLSWLSAFPLSQPFSLHHPSRIQVSSEKEAASDTGAESSAADSDPAYSSKVSWSGSSC